MLKKLIGYSFISLLSFGFFSFCFLTVASAQASSGLVTPLPKAPSPSPTPQPKADLPLAETNNPTPTPEPTATPTVIPSPTPTAIPTSTPVTDLESLFTKYSSQYSVSKDLLEKIAQCESGKNPNASYLSYLGMFQFGPDTWSSIRTRMNLDPNPDLRTNAEEAIKTAAYKISIGGQSAWPNCN